LAARQINKSTSRFRVANVVQEGPATWAPKIIPEGIHQALLPFSFFEGLLQNPGVDAAQQA
jgi:hypothetical protein